MTEQRPALGEVAAARAHAKATPSSPPPSPVSPSDAGGGVDVYESLRAEVLDLMKDRGYRPQDRGEVESLIEARVGDYQKRASVGTAGPRLTDPARIVERLLRSITSNGPFDKYLESPELADEVMFKGGTLSAFTRDGRLEVDEQPTSEAELRRIVERLLADVGASLDMENPIQVRQILGNRARLSVSIPPVADRLDGTIRIHWENRTDLRQLVEWKSLPAAAANFLAGVAHTSPAGVLFSGPPGAGKTTLLAAMLREVPPTVPARIVQQVRELDAPHLPGGRWSPDSGGHTIRTLVQRALQFAPGLLVVSETLGEEAYELLKAGNSGCSLATTLHASSATMALESLVTSALMAGENVPERGVRSAFARLFQVVVHCEAMPLHLVKPSSYRLRQVTEIAVVPPQIAADEFRLEPLFVRQDLGAPMEYTGAPIPPSFERRMNRSLPDGVTVRGLCQAEVTLL